MASYVVSESEPDQRILSAVVKRLLPGQNVVVADGDGKSNGISLARSLLVARRQPVAFAVGAHTQDPDLLREQQQSIDMLLNLVADPSSWAAILFVPELERCFFRDPGFSARLFGGPLSDRQRDLAEYDPRRVLRELAGERWGTEDPDHAVLLEHLAGHDLAPLADDPGIATLVRFLDGVSKRSAA
jgi:hypothetical protein